MYTIKVEVPLSLFYFSARVIVKRRQMILRKQVRLPPVIVGRGFGVDA